MSLLDLWRERHSSSPTVKVEPPTAPVGIGINETLDMCDVDKSFVAYLSREDWAAVAPGLTRSIWTDAKHWSGRKVRPGREVMYTEKAEALEAAGAAIEVIDAALEGLG